MSLRYDSFEDVLPLIQQIILDAYKTEVRFYRYPYEKLKYTDRGFRRMLWGQTEVPKVFSEYLNDASEYKMGIVKSSLGYYNIYASVSIIGKYPEFISIGPF